MRPEAIVILVLAGVVALVGLAALVDAVAAEPRPRGERRRRERAERNRGGEALVGIGLLAVAAAIAGQDVWRYRAVAALAGTVLVLLGGLLNGRYLVERLFHRGAARRRLPGERLAGAPEPGAPGADERPARDGS